MISCFLLSTDAHTLMFTYLHYRATTDVADDEEWGWGDDNINTNNTSNRDDNGLEMTAPVVPPRGMSFSKAEKAKKSPKSMRQTTASVFRSPPSGENEFAIPPVKNDSPLHRTSSGGKPKPPKKSPGSRAGRLAPKPAPPQDDIFSTMGLSAKPTFGRPTPSRAPSSFGSTGSSRLQQSATAMPTVPTTARSTSLAATAAAAATTTGSVDAGTDWDDSDLDDLLND